MKNFLFILLATFSGFGLQAQNNQIMSTAVIDDHFIISLPSESVITDKYTFSIAHLNINDKNICDMLFQNLSETIATYVADFEKQIVTVSLVYNTYNQNWKLADWNAYFAQRGKKMEAYYLHISK